MSRSTVLICHSNISPWFDKDQTSDTGRDCSSPCWWQVICTNIPPRHDTYCLWSRYSNIYLVVRSFHSWTLDATQLQNALFNRFFNKNETFWTQFNKQCVYMENLLACCHRNIFVMPIYSYWATDDNFSLIFFCFYFQVREEGLHKLWQGVTPAVYRHLGMWLFPGQRSCNLLFWMLKQSRM